METKELQKQLRNIAAKMGWSINELARNIYTEMNDFDCEDEVRKFEQNFIKSLSRSTTKKEKLSEYLDIISRHHAVERHSVILPVYRSTGILNKESEMAMKRISESITKSLN
ncbi:hypothetical protein [Alcanivorax profundi]|uniref:hypothetical protein n=1 Tax=Alcanivorax profundi TaxID=2338368 RepID=UPI0032B2F907|tara:strand:- start:1793 stop:2128 length:336 start_codon:yes stop_codon:yes gene_type:complete